MQTPVNSRTTLFSSRGERYARGTYNADEMFIRRARNPRNHPVTRRTATPAARTESREYDHPMPDDKVKRIYWHRELPPQSADPAGEHWVEARSEPIPYLYSRKNELWGQCIDSLSAHARERLLDELDRLGGDYAHVMDEAVTVKIDHEKSLYWLEGRYDYMLYRDPPVDQRAPA